MPNRKLPPVTATDSSASHADPTGLVMSALRWLLKPVVRLAMHHQIGFPAFAELLKSIYVETAEQAFKIDGKPQSDSRLHVLTGIHRRDIKRLRKQTPASVTVPNNISIGGQAVSRWCTDARFTDADGHPLPLPRRSADDSGVSFNALIASVSKDIRPKTVLEEWLRIGVVELNDQGHVRLRTEAFIPDRGLEEKLYYLGRNLHDHIAACEHNIDTQEAPFFERSVHYPALHAEDVAVLQARAAELAMETLTTLNALAVELRARSQDKPGPRERINFGAYFFKAPAETDHDETSH